MAEPKKTLTAVEALRKEEARLAEVYREPSFAERAVVRKAQREKLRKDRVRNAIINNPDLQQLVGSSTSKEGSSTEKK